MPKATKHLAALLIGTTFMGITPVIPSEMQLLYSYQTTYQSQFDQYSSPTTTFTRAQKRTFSDDDGNGMISVSVFADRAGNIVPVQISDDTYYKMTRRNGQAFNPREQDYASLFETYFTPTAEAAIAFDSSQTAGMNGVTSITFSHTITGTDTYLQVCAFTNKTTDQVTGVTYNGAAMTRSTTFRSLTGVGGMSMYRLINPDTGTHNVVVSSSASTYMRAFSASYTGANQSSQPDATGENSGSGTTVTATLTTVASGAWMTSCAFGSGASFTSFSGTQRQNTGEPGAYQDSNGTVSPGPNNQTFTNTSSVNFIWAALSINPTAAASTPPSSQELILFE